MAKRDPLGLIGEKLNRYRIEELAGRGGMSVVYRARHEIIKSMRGSDQT
jgi:hypothetical protein